MSRAAIELLEAVSAATRNIPFAERTTERSTPAEAEVLERANTFPKRLLAPFAMRRPELVWISSDMCALLTAAGPTYPTEGSPPLPPWPDAFCAFAQPFLEIDGLEIAAIQWRHDFHMPCCYGVLPADVTGALGRMFVTIPWGEAMIPGPERQILHALWSLLDDRIAVATPTHPDRAARRRFERDQHQPAPTELIEITLRRPTNTEANDTTTNHIDWTHRWIVDGHWRNQYLPSTRSHRPTWIAPYVKGKGPLVVKDKIYKWTR